MKNETKNDYITTEDEFYMPTEEEIDMMYEEYIKNRYFDELFEELPF